MLVHSRDLRLIILTFLRLKLRLEKNCIPLISE